MQPLTVQPIGQAIQGPALLLTFQHEGRYDACVWGQFRQCVGQAAGAKATVGEEGCDGLPPRSWVARKLRNGAGMASPQTGEPRNTLSYGAKSSRRSANSGVARACRSSRAQATWASYSFG
jgi:hypothetical protein